MSAPEADDKRRNPYEDEPAGIPRWVKVSLILAAVVALLVVVVMLVGGGHSPSRHGAGAGAPVPPAAGTVSFAANHG